MLLYSSGLRDTLVNCIFSSSFEFQQKGFRFARFLGSFSRSVMGVKNLWDILDSCKKTLPLHHLQNKRLCVDLSCWLIQLQNAGRWAKEKIYLRNLFHRLRALIALNCSLILVADGSIPSMKLSTYRRRLGLCEVTRDGANSQAVSSVSLRRNRGSEFSCMVKEAKFLGTALGIPFLDGLEEAEAQCALLNMEALCDGCFSADSDIFLFGARTVYRDIFLGESGYVICYEMEDIEQKLGFGRNSLISLALLLGSDYSHGVHGFGRETACRIVKSLGDDSVLHQIISKKLKIARNCGGKKMTDSASCNADKENEDGLKRSVCENWQDAGSDSQYVDVINAYLKPKCHSADSDAVKRICNQFAFQRTELQHLCEQYFGWSPDKTDEYILPKIAERDLRRFANLRSASSMLGARIPLHEMPVPCPVSAIIKQRKMHGKDCYEVSWQGMDGLTTSTIPADLIDSACPEKVAEFMDKKAEKRKQIRKPKKSNKEAVKEVDLQLEGLLLSIQSQCENPVAVPEVANCPPPPTNSCSCSTAVPEVIDLSSPSPPLRACKIAKRLTPIELHANVIDICESESDETPEHERKARELRSFIDSIRKDLY